MVDQPSNGADRAVRTVVITGGSDGMGRALALERAVRGDRVVAIGSSQAKGDRLLGDAAAAGLEGRVEFVAADLSSVGDNRAVIEYTTTRYGVIDALVLAANRQSPTRVETPEGFESTFALYYLSRYILSYGFMAALARSSAPVVVNVTGVGVTAGRVHWDDPQSRRRYRMVAAQLHAGRANDLLGVAVAEQHGARVPYVLYHPGFTRSGDSAMERVNPLTRSIVKGLAAVAARPVERSIAPVHGFIDAPPAAPLTAVDRGRPVSLDLRTLNPIAARHLTQITNQMLTVDPAPDQRRGTQR